MGIQAFNPVSDDNWKASLALVLTGGILSLGKALPIKQLDFPVGTSLLAGATAYLARIAVTQGKICYDQWDTGESGYFAQEGLKEAAVATLLAGALLGMQACSKSRNYLPNWAKVDLDKSFAIATTAMVLTAYVSTFFNAKTDGTPEE